MTDTAKPCGCSPDHGSMVDADCCLRAGQFGACGCACHVNGAILVFPSRSREESTSPASAPHAIPVTDLTAYRSARASRSDEPDIDLSAVTWMDDLLRDFPLVLTERTTHEGAVLLGPHHAVRAPAVRPYLRAVLKAALRALCPACNEGPLKNTETGWCSLHAQTEELDRRVAVAVDGALGQRNDPAAAKEGDSP